MNGERPKNKKPIATIICGNCKHFEGIVSLYYGKCKRYPQSIEKNENDWCGEFVMAQELKIFKEREAVHGKWEFRYDPLYHPYYACSNCGHAVINEMPSCCPKCRAIMDY